jgi:hypothetical protein
MLSQEKISESVTRRKKNDKEQTTIHNKLHRILKIEVHELH